MQKATRNTHVFSGHKGAYLGSRFLLLAILGMSLVWNSVALAVPITYEEVFDQNLSVREGQRAVYNFDLNTIGGSSFVKDAGLIISPRYLPTVDETTFNTNLDVTSALLSFEIGGMDGGNFFPRERIKIKVSGENGTGDTIFNETVFLGIQTFNFNLTGSWLDWLDDGKLRTVAIAVNRSGFDNDFRIRRASLLVSAEAPAPVPEPASLILMGSGLMALALYGRKQSKKKK